MKPGIRSAFLLSTLLALALLASPILTAEAEAAEPQWQSVGPYGHDGYRFFLTGDPDILYVTTFYSGLYRSEDGGLSWRMVYPVTFGALSVDPRDPDVLFGQTGYQEKVVRSTDGGRTFVEAADGLLYQDHNPTVYTFVRDPVNPDIVLAATSDGLFRWDGVQRWELIAFAGRAVTALAIDPLAPTTWHAATTNPIELEPTELSISTDAGATWTPVPASFGREEIRTIFFDPVRPHRAYALANCRPVVFTGGAWRPLPLASPRLTCSMTITAEGRLVAPYFVTSGSRGAGVVVSDDGGVTWTAYGSLKDVIFRIEALKESDIEGDVLIASGGRGLWRSVDNGVTWQASSEGITGFVMRDVVVASDGTIFVSPGGEGVFRSRDSGRSWQRVSRGLNGDALGTPDLAVDPRNPAVVWAGGVELHRSTDAGRTWQGLGLTRHVEGRLIQQILIDPTREGVVYVSTYEPIGPGILGAYVYRTLDDGQSWQRLRPLDQKAGILAVAPSDGTLYAAGFQGLYVSKDAGATWQRVRRTLPMRVNVLAVDPERPEVLWVGSDESGVWRSTDGGRSFANLQKGELLLSSIGSIVFDPADPTRPYITAGGVYQWRNGWRKVGAGNPGPINGALAFDAERDILYATTSTRGLSRLRF